MLNKKIINLILSSSSVPYELTITSGNGLIFAKKIIYSNKSRVCLCTNSCTLRLIAKYQNQTLVKSTVLQNLKYQTIIAIFNFTLVTPNNIPTPQNFNLFDKNYNLPIKNATLNFTQS